MFFFGRCILDSGHGQEVGGGTGDSLLGTRSSRAAHSSLPGTATFCFSQPTLAPGPGLPLQAALPPRPTSPRAAFYFSGERGESGEPSGWLLHPILPGRGKRQLLRYLLGESVL